MLTAGRGEQQAAAARAPSRCRNSNAWVSNCGACRASLSQAGMHGGGGSLADASPDAASALAACQVPADLIGRRVPPRHAHRIVNPGPSQERHDAGEGASADARGAGRSLMVVNKWRQKEKLKTTAVALVGLGTSSAAGAVQFGNTLVVANSYGAAVLQHQRQGQGAWPYRLFVAGVPTPAGRVLPPSGALPEHRSGPPRRRKDLPLRAPGVLGGPTQHAACESAGDDWCGA
jgi:hypothetical protein